MKRVFYCWMMKLAYKMAMYHDEKFFKWRGRQRKWLIKWEKCYITGGGADNADPD